MKRILFLLFISFLVGQGVYAEQVRNSSAKHLFHFGLGPVWFNNFGVTSAGYGLQGGRNFEVEFGQAFLDVNAAIHEQGVGSLGGHIGLNYYKELSETINFFGGAKGGLSYLHSKLHNNSFSFTMGLQSGIRFFPESDIHIDLSANYVAFVNAEGLSTPSEFSLNLTLSSPWKV